MAFIVKVAQCPLSELESDPALPAILEEYAAECAIDGLPHPSAKVDMYKQLEAAGWLTAFVARRGDTLAGYIFVLVSVIPHYGVHVATVESFFVPKEHRPGGVGLMLKRAAEEHAKAKGSPGILITAPVGGPLAFLLSHQPDYVETNRVFFKAL